MDTRTGRRLRGGPVKFLAGLVDELIGYAEWAFRKHRKRSDGAAEGDHATAAKDIFAKLGGAAKKPVALSAPDPEFPEQIAYLWNWFGEIIEGCESGFGPAIVTWPTLASWAGFMRVDLEPWEARTLVRLGTVRAAILSEDAGGNKDASAADL